MCWRMSCAVHSPMARLRRRRVLRDEDDQAHVYWSRRLADEYLARERERRRDTVIGIFAAPTAASIAFEMPAVIVPAQLSPQAAVALMNALNLTFPDGFVNEADRRAFSDVSKVVARNRQAQLRARWSADRR